MKSLLRACSAEENDIVHYYVINECLFKSGFDGEISDQEFLLGAETFLVILDEAVTNGVFDSPFYVVDNEFRFWSKISWMIWILTFLESSSAN